jgi:hypothetical protein
VHGRLAFLLLPSDGRVKTKNPPPFGSGLINSGERSKPDCRAGQQRVCQQQVQIAIHAGKLVLSARSVNGIRFRTGMHGWL